MGYQEKVVYFLGAGFSAPLGLPVIRQFIQRAKDIYFGNRAKYAHFLKVFELLDKMGKAERYYHCDLYNIEEVFSILEMQDYVSDSGNRERFAYFISSTIRDSTPMLDYGGNDLWDFLTPPPEEPEIERLRFRFFLAFVASLFGLVISRDNIAVDFVRRELPAKYAIISLNYDTVLEIAAAAFGTPLVRFGKVAPFSDDPPILAKLHGTVDDGGTIIPPTWNKVASSEVKDAWKAAYQALKDATQIRFIGYSLPIHDAYIPFLLKAAVLHSENLKRIDVLCLDPTGAVRERYDAFLRFYDYRFVNDNTMSYLRSCQRSFSPVGSPVGSQAAYTNLETIHEHFFTVPPTERKV